MLPRRRIIGGVTERPLESELNSYSKLDKKGLSHTEPKFYQIAPTSTTTTQYFQLEGQEDDIVFKILEDFVFEPVMAARDRTNEFISTVRSLQGRTLARPTVRDERKAVILETYSQFMSSAKVISKNITSTYAKLEKLALCKYVINYWIIQV
ncbi:hypothetical protein O3G_MSEX015215 [Manduca sexta]|uniref:Syntaxin-5 N-terminal Sly1p-binding domain-containing protein n=1 Tax=Manduca sexta TaxID=7130 RepID=A0A921ZY49_MANSE|nr:hypothetical protein O3G_MSEX015215 [Manduca sexta]